MKKIMFSDKFDLTEAVLSGRKTQTRRIYPDGTPLGNWAETVKKSRYQVGEVVAVAQSYASIVDELEDPKNFCCMEHWESAGPKRAHYAGFLYHPGMTNKMFVSAKEMPHHIRITDVRVERLQDISYEDCIAEGVYILGEDPMNPQAYIYTFPNSPEVYYHPCEAYAALIDRISGKGTFESNPYVFVYEFELIK